MVLVEFVVVVVDIFAEVAHRVVVVVVAVVAVVVAVVVADAGNIVVGKTVVVDVGTFLTYVVVV